MLYKLTESFSQHFGLRGNFEADSDEAYFCAQFIKRREFDLQEIALPIGVAYNLISVFLVGLFTDSQTITAILSVVHVFNALLCVAAIIQSRLQSFFRKLWPAVLVLSPAAYLIVSKINIERLVESELVISISLSVLLSIFGIILFPSRPRLLVVTALILSVLGCFATLNHVSCLQFTFIFSLACLTTTIYRVLQYSQQRQIARREYSALVQTVPAKIVRHSVESNQSLSEIFSTKLRNSVCLSTDWRSYQALSAKTDAGTLSRALGEYYNMCGVIFSKHFPKGNYYADWIADELFVVAFAQDDYMDHALVDNMILAAIDMIEQKKEFHKKFGFPSAIDVGICSGTCLIGMMGPDWHKKATALGEVAGRSRRYQSVGKLIRKMQGDTDRIVFGPEAKIGISRPFDVKALQLPEGRRLRDLDDAALFYIESPDVSGPPGDRIEDDLKAV